jgi:dihydrofolate reductase
MASVIWSTTMSLDGYIAGPDDAMDWVFRFTGAGENADEIISSTGAILAGRRSYDVGRKPGQRPEAREAFGGAWRGPQFVLTHHPPTDEDDDTITFLNGDIVAAVAAATVAAGGKDVLVLGADVARQCIDSLLIDEILIFLVPILLGDGVRLFARKGAPVDLNVLSVAQFGQVTYLRLAVVPPADEAPGFRFRPKMK